MKEGADEQQLYKITNTHYGTNTMPLFTPELQQFGGEDARIHTTSGTSLQTHHSLVCLPTVT